MTVVMHRKAHGQKGTVRGLPVANHGQDGRATTVTRREAQSFAHDSVGGPERPP
jgi:hypothetical protein